MDAARAQDTLDLKGDCHGDSRSRLFLRFGAGRNHLSGFAALLIELRQARGSGAVTVPPLGRTVLCEIRTDHTGQRNAGAASVRIGNIAHSNLASRQRNCGSPVIGTAGYGPLRMAENDQSSDLPRVKLQILFGCLINCALLLNAARKAQTSLPPKQADQLLPHPPPARPDVANGRNGPYRWGPFEFQRPIAML